MAKTANISMCFSSSTGLKVPRWSIKSIAIIYIVMMWNFVAGNQCPSGTTVSQVDEYNLIDWSISNTRSLSRSVYISPTSGASYIVSYVNTGINSTVILKLDSSGDQIYSKLYTSQQVYRSGFIVDNGENYMYMVDSEPEVTVLQIVKANAATGDVDSVFEE
jgi:hypothetical protein